MIEFAPSDSFWPLCVGGKSKPNKLKLKAAIQNGPKVMKKFTIAAALIGGVLLTSQSGFAQSTFVANDLYLGFQNAGGGGTEDYIINLGAASGIVVGQSSVVDLSSLFSLSDFYAVLGTNSSSMYGGVVGGRQAGIGTADVYLTQFRNGGAGNQLVPGSSVSSMMTRAGINNSVSALTQLAAPGALTGVLDTTKSWEAYVEPTLSLASFYGQSGFNPDSPVSPSGIFYEDLYLNANGNISGSTAFTYEGYFTLDLTGGSPSLMFTNVPEPGTCAMLSGLGLLMLALRRQSNRQRS